MSNLGKIFLYIALAGALAALGVGGALINKRWQDAALLQQTQQAKNLADQAAKTAKAQAQAAESDKEDAEKKLSDANSQVTDLTSKLSDAQKQVDDGKKALDDANSKVSDIQSKLDALNTALGGQSPDDLKQQIAKGQSDLQAAQAEQKILQDSLQQATAQVETYKDALARAAKGENKPGVAGRVTFVDRTWNFVVLNIGIADGVVPNGELIVYHGRDFLGKVRITKADENDSVAEILPDIKGDIQIGDSVLN